MKKALWIFSLMIIPLVVFCQQDSTAYPTPGSIMDIFTDLRYWFSSTATVAGLTIFLTLLVSKIWEKITAVWKQIVALVISLILMIAGNLFNLGFMADFTWVTTVVYGLVVGFMANGLYDLKNVVKK